MTDRPLDRAYLIMVTALLLYFLLLGYVTGSMIW